MPSVEGLHEPATAAHGDPDRSTGPANREARPEARVDQPLLKFSGAAGGDAESGNAGFGKTLMRRGRVVLQG